MKKKYDDVIKSVIEPQLLTCGFKRIPYKSTCAEKQGWIYYRVRNEIKQDVTITICVDDVTYLCLSTYNDIHYGKRFPFSSIGDFEYAAFSIKDNIISDLLPKLDQIADKNDIIKRHNELFLFQNYEKFLERFFDKNPLVKNTSLVMQYRFLDICIEKSKSLQFCDALDDIYEMSAFFCYILLRCENAKMVYDDSTGHIVVFRNVTETGMRYNRFPLVHIYKLWASKNTSLHTIQFLKFFLSNPEIMCDSEIRDELVGIGVFDLEKGY